MLFNEKMVERRIGVRIEEDLKNQIEEVAELRSENLSGFVRRAVLKERASLSVPDNKQETIRKHVREKEAQSNEVKPEKKGFQKDEAAAETFKLFGEGHESTKVVQKLELDPEYVEELYEKYQTFEKMYAPRIENPQEKENPDIVPYTTLRLAMLLDSLGDPFEVIIRTREEYNKDIGKESKNYKSEFILSRIFIGLLPVFALFGFHFLILPDAQTVPTIWLYGALGALSFLVYFFGFLEYDKKFGANKLENNTLIKSFRKEKTSIYISFIETALIIGLGSLLSLWIP